MFPYASHIPIYAGLHKFFYFLLWDCMFSVLLQPFIKWLNLVPVIALFIAYSLQNPRLIVLVLSILNQWPLVKRDFSLCCRQQR